MQGYRARLHPRNADLFASNIRTCAARLGNPLM
jgi:hypothetical protein